METNTDRRCQAQLEGKRCPDAARCQLHANWLKEPKPFGSLTLPRVLPHACMFFVPVSDQGNDQLEPLPQAVGSKRQFGL